MKYFTLFCFVFSSAFSASSQLEYFSPEVSEGYTLLAIGGSVHLVNNCGEEVNKWNFVNPQYHSKLLPNGNLIYIEWVSDLVVERNWDGTIVKETAVEDEHIDLDYEVIVLPNGNYLCVGRIEYTEEEFEAIGFTDYGVGFPERVDVVVEFDSNTGEVVWLWNTADHVIQDKDPALPNYGVVKDHPERMDMAGISTIDWPDEFFMINGMDYNENLDQIVVSLRKAGEIAIIDHSTTTEEAASSSGGTSGMGGDLMYRWGNPQNYDRGTEEDKYLFFQHNPNWIKHGTHAGRMILYNNGIHRPNVSYYERYSTVPIISTPIVPITGKYEIEEGKPFAPAMPLVDYSEVTTGHDFYSNYTSAAKVMPNGNVLISVGGDSEIFEIKPDGTEVWRYHLPTDPFLFRVEKYPPDYGAFVNRDLTPMGTIEDPSSTVPCNLNTAVLEQELVADFKVWLSPDDNVLHISSDSNNDFDYDLYDFYGKNILKGTGFTSADRAIGDLSSGIYLVKITDQNRALIQTAKIFVK